MESRAPQLERRHWSFVIAYCMATSLAIGVIVPGAFSLISVLRGKLRFDSGGRVLHGLLIIMAIVSAVFFIIQLFGGPFVLSRDVVCRTCHRRQKLNRNPLFAGKGYRVPACDCCGDLEPAIFWRLES
jgi:hypothetical protein